MFVYSLLEILWAPQKLQSLQSSWSWKKNSVVFSLRMEGPGSPDLNQNLRVLKHRAPALCGSACDFNVCIQPQNWENEELLSTKKMSRVPSAGHAISDEPQLTSWKKVKRHLQSWEKSQINHWLSFSMQRIVLGTSLCFLDQTFDAEKCSGYKLGFRGSNVCAEFEYGYGSTGRVESHIWEAWPETPVWPRNSRLRAASTILSKDLESTHILGRKEYFGHTRIFRSSYGLVESKHWDLALKVQLNPKPNRESIHKYPKRQLGPDMTRNLA